MATQLNAPCRPNKPTSPQKPNGIAHMTNDVVGSSDNISSQLTTRKAERHAAKADWALFCAAWKTAHKSGGSLPAAYDGTFTSVDGSTAVNLQYADE